MRYLRLLLLGLLAGVVAAGAPWRQGAQADDPPTQPGVIDRVLVDADPSTPGAITTGGDPDVGTLGTVETCRDGVSLSDPVSVDFILDAIDPADGTLDWGGGATVGVRFDDSRLDFVSVEGIGLLQLSQPPSVGVVEFVDSTFSRLQGFGIGKLPGNYPEFSGAHLLYRVNFTAEATGYASIGPENVPGFDEERDFVAAMGDMSANLFDLNDENLDGYTVNSFEGAALAIGVSCDADSDADGVFDIDDNCSGDYNPLQENADFDLNSGGATVNSVPLPSDADGDACDDDDDNDSFNGTTALSWIPGSAATGCPGSAVGRWADCVESYLGTDLDDNCNGSPGTGTDAWPPDIDRSKKISGGDVFAIFPYWLTSTARHDLDASGTVSGGDVFSVFPWWLISCT